PASMSPRRFERPNAEPRLRAPGGGGSDKGALLPDRHAHARTGGMFDRHDSGGSDAASLARQSRLDANVWQNASMAQARRASLRLGFGDFRRTADARLDVGPLWSILKFARRPKLSRQSLCLHRPGRFAPVAAVSVGTTAPRWICELRRAASDAGFRMLLRREGEPKPEKKETRMMQPITKRVSYPPKQQ